MGFSFVVNKLKSLLLFIAATFRKALCCFRRRKRVSFNESDQLTHVGVVSNQTVNEFEEWSEWNNSSLENHTPQTIQEHIDYYRMKRAQIVQELENQAENNEEDFFEDMTPKITRQTKVIVDSSQSEASSHKNSLSLTPEHVAYFGNELQEWEDTAGWGGDKVEIESVLRESRRLAREKRAWEQQQKRSEKNNRPLPLGAKIKT